MLLLLQRHGIAAADEIPVDPPLSTEGEEQIKQLAAFLKQQNMHLERVFHSDKHRAKQTATIMAESLASADALEMLDGLHPNDPAQPIAAKAQQWLETTLVVGHLPFMPTLVSLLTTGTEDALQVEFVPGTVVALQRGSEGMWQFVWMMQPGFAAIKGLGTSSLSQNTSSRTS